MTDWQITAKTIYCDAVTDEVTIIVKRDWTFQCTGCEESTAQTGAAPAIVRKSGNCEGIKCARVTDYVKNLVREENE